MNKVSEKTVERVAAVELGARAREGEGAGVGAGEDEDEGEFRSASPRNCN